MIRRTMQKREKPTELMERPFLKGFDFTKLADGTRQRVEQATARVRELHARMAGDAVQLGRELIAVRNELGPQLFSIWRAAEFHLSENACGSLMRIAQRFGDLPCLDKFQPTALIELARDRVDEEAVQEAVQRAAQGEGISRTRALEIIERCEMAADRDPTPRPRRDEVYRIRSALRTAISRWPADKRGELAEHS